MVSRILILNCKNSQDINSNYSIREERALLEKVVTGIMSKIILLWVVGIY